MTDVDMLDALIDQHNEEISELYENLMTLELQLVDQLEVGCRGKGTWGLPLWVAPGHAVPRPIQHEHLLASMLL